MLNFVYGLPKYRRFVKSKRYAQGSLVCVLFYDFALLIREENNEKFVSNIESMINRGYENAITILWDSDYNNNNNIDFFNDVSSIYNSLGIDDLKNDFILLNWDSHEVIYESLEYKKVKFSDRVIEPNTENGRTYQLSHYCNMFDVNSERLGSFLQDKYIELNSTYIPAYGTNFKVKPHYTESGFGRSYKGNEASIISTIEAFERRAGMFNYCHTVNSKSYKDMMIKYDNVINPQKFILHSEEQYADKRYSLKRYSDVLQFPWVQAQSLTSSRKYWIPAQLIWFGEQKNNESDNTFVYETSNGTAVGGSMEEALKYALYEVIERDAFFDCWYGFGNRKKIDITTSGLSHFRDLYYYLKSREIILSAYLIESITDVPVVWATIESKEGIYNAAAANMDIKKALEGALFEVTTSFPIYINQVSKNLKMRNKIECFNKNGSVDSQQDHILFYFNKENRNIFNKFKQDSKVIEIAEIIPESDTLSTILKKIKLTQKEIYYVDLTDNYLKENDLFAVKVVIPGFLPVTFGEQYRRVDWSELNKRYKNRGRNLEKNLLPHPFP